jgi:nitrate reductase gamma subunit
LGAGTLAAALVIVGVAILAARRLFIAWVRATTSPANWLALILLAIVIAVGIAETVRVGLLGSGQDYGQSMALWFRGLFSGKPDVRAIAHVPLLYQMHAVAAWAILAAWSFSRLVHVWSYPVSYLWRLLVVYRGRVATRPNEPGSSGWRWRKIGAP